MRPTHSEGVRRALAHAQSAAGKYNHRFVHTEYLLIGLLQERNSAGRILKSLGHDRQQLRRACERRCRRGEHPMESALKLTPRVQHVMALAGEQAVERGDGKIQTTDVLLGLLMEEEGIAGDVLRGLGLTVETVRDAIAADTGPADASPSETHRRSSDNHKRHARKPLWKLFLRA